MEITIHTEDSALTEAIVRGVSEEIMEALYGNDLIRIYRGKLEDSIQSIIKENQKKIIDLVVKKVTEAIERKKQLAEITPSLRELSAKDKDNLKYIEELIDKAVARKFR